MILMRKTTVLLIGLAVTVGLCGCAAHFNYEPGGSISPIGVVAEVAVEVKKTEGFCDFPNLEEEIKSAITEDLNHNVFPFLTEIEPDIHVAVTVELLKFSAPPYGFFWFPLWCIGAPVSKLVGSTRTSLSIAIYRTGRLIALYSSSKRLRKWVGLYYGRSYGTGQKKFIAGLALKEAMDDIKSQIERDRNKILQKVREAKEELPSD